VVKIDGDIVGAEVSALIIGPGWTGTEDAYSRGAVDGSASGETTSGGGIVGENVGGGDGNTSCWDGLATRFWRRLWWWDLRWLIGW
ncbi:Hypothetical predicted protein, partial [Olea europaea subsp. europaea]